jgi:very-short-patch-repair endonuclease
VARMADRQHGVLARRQLLEVGLSQDGIRDWVRSGRLTPLHREAFAWGHTRLTRQGWWLAAVLACAEGAVLSHQSAAALWGIARHRRGPIDVTAAAGRQFRPGRPRIRLHRSRLHDAGEVTERNRIPVTSVARTLFDLAEVIDFTQLERAWEEADRLKLLQLLAVEQVCERSYGRRALRPIRRLLAEARAEETVRSPLEERFLAFCHARGISIPATNVHVLGHEVDCLWPAARLIAELDSWEFHGHRSAFERDRARDPKFLLAGYRTIRVTHRRLDREADQLAEEIRGLLRLGVA